MTAKAKADRKARRAGDPEEIALLELLSNGLSEGEIRRVVACALLALDGPGLDRLVARLGEETGGTLRRLLESRGKGPKPGLPIAGAAKVRQEWERAWSDWNACVAESSDENGKYIIQEHHWEAPYLDASALAEDLEPIAARMRKLLGRVMADDLDPDFSFAEALQGTAEDIGSGLPEWMDPSSGEGCPFGPEVTGCLLEWEWRAARRDGVSAFEFADQICKLEASTKGIGLDHDTVAEFILDLDDADQMSILQGMVKHRQSRHWTDALGSAYFGWFLIYQELCRRWDPPRYMESCRKNISQNWELALPVVTDLLGQKVFEGALPLIEEAVRALLHLKEGETWDPRETLLIHHPALRYRGEQTSSVVRLLKGWLKVAEVLGQEETACALELQVTICQKWADWDAALNAFQQIPLPRFAGMHERLFADWRSLVVEESVGRRYDEHEPPGLTWVHGLVDAARAGGDGASLFSRALRHWLKETERTPTALKQALGALGRLTLDLDVGSQLRKTAPTLHRLLSREWEGNRTVSASRRRWLERLEAPSLFSEVIQFWKRNAASLVPDPAQSFGSNYDTCAEWLAAVLELDPSSYKKIVQEWTVTHHRRRNLWKALTKRGLPLGENS